jgi:hypothetical protein
VGIDRTAVIPASTPPVTRFEARYSSSRGRAEPAAAGRAGRPRRYRRVQIKLDQADLRLDEATYRAWREEIDVVRTKDSTRPRADAIVECAGRYRRLPIGKDTVRARVLREMPHAQVRLRDLDSGVEIVE